MAAKKTSAADFRKKEEADKKKMARTDSQGRSGMGASKSNTTKPGFYTTGERTSSKLNTAHNIARSIAVGGPIIKTVMGRIAAAAPQIARGTLTGSGSYTTTNPSAASSYSSIRGINAAGKTVLQEDIGGAILAGKMIASKKKKK